MVSVPKSYPKEPGAERCGDTYKMTAVVNGKIPGTVFGTQFTRNIPPVPIKGTSSLVPVFTSRKNFDESLQREDGLEDRLEDASRTLFVEDFRFTPKEETALKKLIDNAWELIGRAADEVDQIKGEAFPGAGPGKFDEEYGKKAQGLVEDALKHLRCAEYWTWRVILHGQALDEYEAPLGLSAGPAVPIFPAPPESEIPPLPTPPIPPKKKKAAPKKSNTGWIVAGLGLVVAGVIFLPKILKKK